jgi:hypothetical protein
VVVVVPPVVVVVLELQATNSKGTLKAKIWENLLNTGRTPKV